MFNVFLLSKYLTFVRFAQIIRLNGWGGTQDSENRTVSTKFTTEGFKLQVGPRKEAIEAWRVWHSGHIEGSHN